MEQVTKHNFPSTRFVGNKSKIVDWIFDCIGDLDFHRVLDAFGGNASFSYKSKQEGKAVTFNDILKFNWTVGLSLIENSKNTVTEEEFLNCLEKKHSFQYSRKIQSNFKGIYFTDEENQWLDIITQNIHSIDNNYKKAILFCALGQACLIKRPYNLFHRKNLYMRLKDVERTFNNKKCWDTPFQTYFKQFLNEYNLAVFSNGERNVALNLDVFELPTDFDLVYLDPPYMSGKTKTNYLNMYHFLEGIVEYDSWEQKIDHSTKNLRMKPNEAINIWQRKSQITNLLGDLISKFSSSIIVLSYRSDGYPTTNKIVELFKERLGRKPKIYSIPYKYALSKKALCENIFVAYD